MLKKIKEAVEKNPNSVAYKNSDESITYGQLWKRAFYYAQFLKKQGSSPVIIYGHKNVSVIISILACLIADRTYVPIGECTPIYRLKKIAEITKSTLILSDNDISNIEVDYCNLDGLIRYKNNKIKNQENDIVYIIFTSGSTGIPKGVPISKKNLNNFINWINNLKPLCDFKNIKVLNQASFSFDLSVADLYYSLCNGHTLVAFDGDVQDNYDDIFKAFLEVDFAVMTPTFMKICLLNDDFNERKFPKFKCVYFCGEQLEKKLVQKIFTSFPNLQIINAYGPTEATSAVSAINITKDMLEKEEILPVGEINNFATLIEIVNDEIILKGDSVFNGYLLNYDGGHYWENDINCYKTGDVGYIKDGKLYCKGRKDNQIKYKGYRIELADIESNINLIDGIASSVVLAKYDDKKVNVKTIQAFVMVDKKIDIGYIKKELEKLIPKYMMPKMIKIVDKLPINHNGKIDRKALNRL